MSQAPQGARTAGGDLAPQFTLHVIDQHSQLPQRRPRKRMPPPRAVAVRPKFRPQPRVRHNTCRHARAKRPPPPQPRPAPSPNLDVPLVEVARCPLGDDLKHLAVPPEGKQVRPVVLRRELHFTLSRALDQPASPRSTSPSESTTWLQRTCTRCRPAVIVTVAQPACRSPISTTICGELPMCPAAYSPRARSPAPSSAVRPAAVPRANPTKKKATR
jgi:hypothetical protein